MSTIDCQNESIHEWWTHYTKDTYHWFTQYPTSNTHYWYETVDTACRCVIWQSTQAVTSVERNPGITKSQVPQDNTCVTCLEATRDGAIESITLALFPPCHLSSTHLITDILFIHADKPWTFFFAAFLTQKGACMITTTLPRMHQHHTCHCC